MIHRGHPKLSISQQCNLVQHSRSSFYNTPGEIDAETLAMIQEIDRVFTKNRFLVRARSPRFYARKVRSWAVTASGD